MDALVMCGGEGSRMDAAVEKPLVEVGGRPMVDRVLDALAAAGIDAVYAAVSPHAPATDDHLRGRDVTRVETPGEGYVADLGRALDIVEPPAVTVAADLPLLSAGHVDRAIAAAGIGSAADGATASVTVCVSAALKRRLGLAVDERPRTVDRSVPDLLAIGASAATGRPPDRDREIEVVPTGLNVVGTTDESVNDQAVVVSHDARLAVNVNRQSDARVAEALCG